MIAEEVKKNPRIKKFILDHYFDSEEEIDNASRNHWSEILDDLFLISDFEDEYSKEEYDALLKTCSLLEGLLVKRG